MNKFLRYIYATLGVLIFISCTKKSDTAEKITTKNDIEKQPNIVVSPKLLAYELHKINVDSAEIKLKHKDSVIAFYHLRNNKPAWGSLKNRNALYLAVKDADKEGLIPSDYNLKQLEAIIHSGKNSSLNNAVLDLFFTDIYLSYAYHLANGKLNPNKLYKDWKITKNSYSYNQLLNESIQNNNLISILENYKPNQKIYQQLKAELARAKNLINTDSARTIVQQGNKIRPNQTNQRIVTIRKRLNELGYLEDSLVTGSTQLDSTLQTRIKLFQQEKQLQVDAIIGEGTVNALNRTHLDNYHSILANLERWRWFPRNYGETSIVVNIPQYQLTYYSKKDSITHNVIVGKTARKTPVFSSVVKHIDFNPLWYIPPTIKKEDIIPSASKNIEYLRKKNISVYNKQGKKLILDSINWKSREPYSYRYIQAAGNNNALGSLKIIFPNNFSVYLHDTPSKSLFEKNYRAKSSGCVRVQNVTQLAANIIDWPEAKIMSTIDKKQAKRVLATKKINVHFLYWTVLFDKNTKPVFLNDVYNYDSELGKKLTQ